jgi:hypothetical protein
MDCLFAGCNAKKDPVNASSSSILSILAIALFWSSLPALISAQTAESNSEKAIIVELMLGDSAHSAHSEVRVQSVRTRPKIDSLWTDSLWQWRGACSAPSALFHFEWYDPIDSTFAYSLVKEVPCMAQEGESTNSQMTFIGELTAPVSDLYAQATDPNVRPKCFPPTSGQQMIAIQQKMNETIFESEKVQLAIQIIEAKCLDKIQFKQLLQSIPSEDRRLDLFETILAGELAWSTADMEEIFQLQFIEQKAIQLLDKP